MHAELDRQRQYHYLDDGILYELELPVEQPTIAYASPFNCQGGGLHFPLKGNTQVAICYLGGEWSEPVELGSFMKPNQRLCQQQNATFNNVFAFPGDLRFCLSDKVDEELI